MKILLSLFIAFVILTHPAKAAETLSVQAWKNLPILHEGRVKPIDSFARVMLEIFSGSQNIEDMSADEWLVKSLFTPNEAVEIPVFKIRDVTAYGIKENKNNKYSFLELSQVIQNQQKNIQALLETTPKNWTPAQQEVMRLHENFILYTQILRSFTSILPLNIEGQESKNFLSYQPQELEKKLEKIVKRKGASPEKYNENEKKIAFLSYQLNLVKAGGANNVLFRIIPENFDKNEVNYLSFWQAQKLSNTPKKTPETLKYIGFWQEMMDTYRAQNAQKWDKAVALAQDATKDPLLKIESIYNTLHFIQVALMLYSISFLMVIFAALMPKQNKILEDFALGFLSAGLFAHISHIILRVFILGRPPVGTLYESILFVALISVIGFACFAYRQKNTTGVLLGSISGVILLTTAMGFAGEDNMNTLVAVLNTNFWLGTHVLCITIGYGVCFIVSLMAHYWLIRHAITGHTEKFLPQVSRNIKTLVILSLLFTTIGTILGGIWADQSWGRFWGWDPKENGALLIVLWLAWMLHGRMSGHISEMGYAAAAAFLSIIVVLAWFGVNLLSVGLHSYGFISGIAWGIGLFCAFEVLLIGGLWGVLKYNKRHKGRTA